MLISTIYQKLGSDNALLLKKISYVLVLIPMTSVFWVPVVAAHIGDVNIAAVVPFIIFFLFIPAMDIIFGLDTLNPDEQFQVPKQDGQQYYRYLTLLILPALLFMQFWSANYFFTANFNFVGGLAWIIAVGLTSAVLGINVGHELAHKSEKIENFTAGLLLGAVWYGGFKVEHVRGHHVNVSTPGDATSAKFNQNLYHFLPRAYWHNFKAALVLEKKRLEKKGLPWYSLKNELFWWYGFSVLLTSAFGLIWGWQGVLFFLVQAFVAFTVLEVINYVEHYGLRRRKLDNGRYEKPMPEHSWNNSHFFSNMVLFQLQRHSDHHANPKRRYQNLRHYDNVPQLPMGYPIMLLIALLPPLWFKMMNPLVEAHYGNETFYKEIS